MHALFLKTIRELLYILGYIDNSMIYVPTCMSSIVRKSGSMATKNSNPTTKGKTRCIIDENMIKIDVCHNTRLHKLYVRL